MTTRPRRGRGSPSGRTAATNKDSTVRSAPRPPTTDDADGKPDGPGTDRLFPIVGVGASAGGLEAFTQLLGALPTDTGMGFVLVQHLDPDHESALTQILSRATSLPVHEITNDERVRPDHVYVIPRDTSLAIAGGILKIQPRERTRARHRPIDSFFESLAADQHERAVGVVLSGTANDGTLGLEAIKAEGGITFAQDDSAKHDSMPRSAVAAGCVDLVLSPMDIAKELARVAKHPHIVRPSSFPVADERGAQVPKSDEDDRPSLLRVAATLDVVDGVANGYKNILLQLRNHSGVDFSLYKSTTIQRRITRRLVLNKQNTLEDYADFLHDNTKELDALYSDVLISVTSFFRNPETFDALAKSVLPELLKRRGEDPLRVWVLGCSAGQEAYSIAMAFVEASEKAPRTRKLQVFATDLNDALLEKARYGLYTKTLIDEITPQRLRRFFVEEEGGYRVSKSLRDMVVFARQNLLADPPFSRMDLISCRNVMIYLESSVQKKVMPTLHYSLKPGGFLLLGASEAISGFSHLFEAVDKKEKIYCKKSTPVSAPPLPLRMDHSTGPPGSRIAVPIGQPGGPGGAYGELDAQREADRITVNQLAPPSVLVGANLHVLQFRGQTSAYLGPPMGKASFDVLKMAPEGLMLPLRSAIAQAKKDNQTVRRENVRFKRNGKALRVNLEVIPLKNPGGLCFLILFEESEKARGLRALPEPQPSRTHRSTRSEKADRIAELETELSQTREYLASLQEQTEAANEELRAASEEIQSANEELQSSNEELETSKEELESSNEELTTVNEEVSNRNIELNRLNNDLVNLQTSTKLAVVLLGRDLTIRRFSPQAEKQFDLLVGDVGRSIAHIRHNLVVGDAPGSPLDVEGLTAEVISNVLEQEREVRDKVGRWYSLRVRPYITLDNKVDGAVLVLVDIDKLKHSEYTVRDSEARYRAMFESMSVGMSENDIATGRLLRVNEQLARMVGYTAPELVGKTLLELTHRDDQARSWESNNRLTQGEVAFYEVEKRLLRKDGTYVWVHVTVNLVQGAGNRPRRAVLMTLDISERKHTEQALRESHAELVARVDELTRFSRVATDRELRMIELKREVDEVCRRHGEAARYPFELEQEVGIREGSLKEPPEPPEFPHDSLVPLESVLRTEELHRRPSRPPDFETETRALAALAQALADSPRTILQTLAESIRDVFKVDSAGLSLLTKDGRRFYSPAIAGVWKPHVGAEAPRDFGPSGDVLDANAPQLFSHFERRYTYLLPSAPPAEECLLVPFYVEGKAVGTIWAIAHDHRRKFDDEDLRQLVSVGRFASAAYQAVELKQAQQSRLAALNLMEDAVASREAMGTLNKELRERDAALSDADRRKNEFLAMLGHELRNPLAALTSGVDLLGRVSDDRVRSEQTRAMIVRHTKRIANLLDQLLDIARVISDKVELSKERVDLADVVRTAVE